MGSRSKRKKHLPETSDDDSPSSSPSNSDESDRSSKRRRRHRHRSDDGSRREKARRRERREKRRSKREARRSKSKTKTKKKKRDYDSGSGSSSGGGDSEPERSRVEPREVLRDLFSEFPNVGDDLKQLLQMIDSGQAVDIKGISERSLIKHLKKLFLSLDLKESDGVFVLPSNVRPTLEVVGVMIPTSVDLKSSLNEMHSEQRDEEYKQVVGDDNMASPCPEDNVAGPNRRIIGPAMPSAELLAAAAKLTEAQAELREVELEEDAGMFIGPPPPAVVAEVESANEAERFEEVTRIIDAEENSPYDVLGANQNMAPENIKKRYWKMSLLVHPDKCSHPQAQQAFVKLNKAFKDLQDPEKRKVLDEKIKLKEEHEKFKVELRAMREAAQWRKLQGISMEGDDELLADMDVKVAPQRDEWMTTLPPERRPGGMPTQSTKFSSTVKEGRGDTSAWTDTPSDRAQKAKMDYLEAYNEAASLASNEEKKMNSSDADLVDRYNKEKRSKSLVQKHQETASRPKRKSKQPLEKEKKEEWVGKHPWKPWDREKDLTGGRQSVKLDSENMAQGLTSRFSAGSFQRNFL
ncbi:putative DnaJ domain-containing protein [Rosa chinensis]|uniref:Putative DnaJ domain-containing protein n=1 Tax=Rosa chinensis TaxID=74649 RepID=A0A2P6QS91_ROSCH|nr:uncharacterized protein LOC112200485 [Rosa chinensis]PRQ37044.1 putative DnaJ domain-containing protein [Rosa chinensis]